MAKEQSPQINDLITIPQAAELFEMGESTAWLLIKRHNLDRYRLPGQGKKTFVRRDDFEQAYRTPVPVLSDSKKEAA